MAVSWPLWTAASQVPAVPLFAVLQPVPLMVDRILALILAALLMASALLLALRFRTAVPVKRWFAGNRMLFGLLAAAGCASLMLVTLNQHRLQPWLWLFLLCTGQWLTCPQRSLVLWRQTLATIYIFAAVSRFGPAIDSGMSLQLVNVASEMLQLPLLMQNADLVLGLCIAMSGVELLTGLGLLIVRTRRAAAIVGILVHALLLLLLSPLGLNQQPGVLVWNFFLLVALLLLFFRTRTVARTQQTAGSLPAAIWMTIIWAVPASGLVGVADNWIAWQVYSPRPEVVQLQIHEAAVDDLPRSLQPFLQPPALLDSWHPLRLDQWVLQQTKVPVYPEDRFQIAVLRAAVADVPRNGYRLKFDRPDRPAWWQQERFEFETVKQLQTAAGPFVLNSTALRNVPIDR